ncbi:hypothetical protein [Mycobacterium intracellulare]|uniref:hypothetical protein n=1 Tax=Mycobacterium intracellulare TaxID=1767 RepID=UPI001926CA07|nr:hypothetical protein [Mycobacterium intracellulare]BCP29581.1 hypothetical protein MINTM026_05510 [Mycobacterium intracellulare]
MAVVDLTRYQLACDRCVHNDIVTFNPLADSSQSRLADLGWQFWGRIGWGTGQHLLCPTCVAALRKFLEPTGDPR